MHELSTDLREVRKIRCIKRSGDTFDITQDECNYLEECKKKWTFAKIIDMNGKIIFWWDPKDIKEFTVTDEDYKKKIYQKENIEQSEYSKRFMDNNKKKLEWTKRKLEELTPDEIEYFRDNARHNLKTAIQKKNVWEKFIERYAMCLLRKHFECPYS